MSAAVFKSIGPTKKEQDLKLVKRHIRKLLYDVTADAFLLAEVVAAGGSNWRRQVHAAFHPYPLTDDVADRMFLFFCAAVQAKWGAGSTDAGEGFKSEHLDAALVAGDFLDSCVPVAQRPSPEEVAKSWKIEDGSSEAAKRAEYDATGMHPQEALDKLIQMDADKEKAH